MNISFFVCVCVCALISHIISQTLNPPSGDIQNNLDSPFTFHSSHSSSIPSRHKPRIIKFWRLARPKMKKTLPWTTGFRSIHVYVLNMIPWCYRTHETSISPYHISSKPIQSIHGQTNAGPSLYIGRLIG